MCTTTKIGATFELDEDKIDNNAEVPPVDAPIAITSQERVLLGFVFDCLAPFLSATNFCFL